MTRALGWRPDPPKGPDETPDFDADRLLRAGVVPTWADNRRLVLSVLDQGGAGSCVAQAGMQAVRASLVRQGVANPPLGSRLFGYYLARAHHNETQVDSGTHIRYFFGALSKMGFPREELWPYIDDGKAFARAPSAEAIRAAYDQKSPTRYYRIYDDGAARVTAVKRALASGFLVVWGTSIGESFLGDPGQLAEPPLNEPIAGGHAMTLVGYSPAGFDCVNSWGISWGREGYCTMSADYIAWSGSDDFWLVEQAPPFSGIA